MNRAFCEKPVLQNFYLFKLIRIETDAFEKTIEEVFYQEDTDMNWHPVAHYSHKMFPVEYNYETHNVERLAIVAAFKMWRHYHQRAANTILVLTDYNNLKKNS